ncbi:HER225Wp [Eremothecium sinecaudum]|uniref:HER225Wp n=1 Tax=Eremothecium sinecaudum TaxID=45286 RepID=A0A0X8HU82_9SACH|nr:HER225Wp [Eremothecium sinecaudum]AMD21503.1 HER225Wp [Eremothecium sinecaudum]
MVKKHLNSIKIDFKKCIIEDCLLQIRNLKHINEPDLVKVWTIEIAPKDTPLVLNFIKEYFSDDDPVTYLHCKRIQKSADGSKLCVILCSTKLISDADDVCKKLKEADFAYEKLAQHDLPMVAPYSRELSREWSTRYWPLVWRGNPNDQILNDCVFDIPYIKKILEKVESKCIEIKDSKKGLPIVTAFVNPADVNNPYFEIDYRFEGDALCHSIMQGIRKVANEEAKRRERVSKGLEEARIDNYLCLDFEVYTSHEPCSMCAMALIHSRIKRCIFIEPRTKTGSLKQDSGDGYCMHNNKELNSKYEVFQWVGKQFSLPEIGADECC